MKILKKIEKKEKEKEEIEKNITQQQTIKHKLENEYTDLLNKKTYYYKDEKPRLLKKARESKSEIENMNKVESELAQLNKEKSETIKKHEENQKK